MTDAANESDGSEEIFVVRSPGEWTITRVPAGDPESATIDDVLYHLDRRPTAADLHAVWSGPGGTPRVPDPLTDADEVEPVWLWVGRAVAEGVVVEDPGGGAVILDRDDLRLLDRIHGRVPVSAVLDPAGSGDATRSRLADLVSAGRLLKVAPVDVGAEMTANEATTEAAGSSAVVNGSVTGTPTAMVLEDPAPGAPGSGSPSGGDRLPVPLRRAYLRLATAWRLSSRLRPLRQAVDRVVGR